jgi:hypothetical protein
MAYIGKDPAQIKRALNEKDTFTGDGSTVAFDLTSDASSANEIQVFVDNIRQEPGASDAYTLGEDGSGNLRRITFTAAPDSGAEIYVLNPKTTDSNLIVPSDNSVTEAKIATGAVTSTKILDGTIVNADINACAAISDTKLGTISTACKVATTAISQPGSSSVYLAGDGSWGAIDTSQQDTNAFNISLLGFKMAVNEGLTVFNLVDGVVDEFNDESGTDEAEGSNDNYCATCDFYKNANDPASYSAGFTTTSVTEPDTSTAGTNPAVGSGTFGSFCVPACMTSVNIYTWGAGGASQAYLSPCRTSSSYGGGGGFSSGILSVTPGQTLGIVVGEGARGAVTPQGQTKQGGLGGGGGTPLTMPTSNDGMGGAGGGLSGAFNCTATSEPALTTAPQAYIIAGGGGGSGLAFVAAPQCNTSGGQGGGSFGLAGATINPGAQTSSDAPTGAGGGGSQTVGGSSRSAPEAAADGSLFNGGTSCGNDQTGGGGGGYYGGGAGGPATSPCTYGAAGGGGSGYIAHPQITCGSFAPQATGGTNKRVGAGVPSPLYVAGTNNGAIANVPISSDNGEDGYVLLTATVCGGTTSTTIVSTAFTSTSVPTSARIVVFEENVDTPTLNTDIIASISRDGGSTFTNATLTDSGYVTGSSGQRILTGQATISGQPSGQSMRWKLALANNTVKIHGVSLQWA